MNLHIRWILFVSMAATKSARALSSTPSRKPSVAIIGGGIAGLTCAKYLENDYKVTVYDTGRLRPGGRCSARLPGDIPKETEERMSFLSKCVMDHAAQVISVPDEASQFEKQVQQWKNDGVVAPFPHSSLFVLSSRSGKEACMPIPSTNQYYAIGGMQKLSEALIQGSSFDMEQDKWVSPSNGVQYNDKKKQWKVQGSRTMYDYLIIAHNGKCADRLMSRTPASDVHELLRVNFAPSVPDNGGKRMTLNSIYSVSVALPKESVLTKKLPLSFWSGFVRGDPTLRFLTCQTRKHPCDSDEEVWTLLSSPSFAKKYKGPQEFLPIELREEVTDRMLRSLESVLNLEPNSIVPLEKRVQLWGAALPLNTWDNGHGFIFDNVHNVGVCGDWLMDPSIAGAYESGHRLAQHLRTKVLAKDGGDLAADANTNTNVNGNAGTVGLSGRWKPSQAAKEAGIGALVLPRKPVPARSTTDVSISAR